MERKLKRRRRTTAIKVFLILFIICLIAAGVYFYTTNKKFSGYKIEHTYAKNYYDGSTLVSFAGNTLTYSKDGANVTDKQGKNIWNITYNMQNPLVSCSKTRVAFADYSGNLIYMVTKQGDVKEIKTDMPVLNIAVADDGYVVAVLDDSSVTWVYMYDSNGEIIAYSRTTMEKSGYPVSISVSPSGEIVAISYYYLDAGERNSKVAFYNFGEVGKNNIDNYVSGYVYKDTLVPYVQFLNNDNAFMLSTDRLSFYEGAHKPVSVSDMFINETVYSVYYSENLVGTVTGNESKGTKYCLKLYNTMGKLEAEIPFDYDYSGVEIGSQSIVIYGDTNLTITNLKGKIRYEGNYEDTMLLIYPGTQANKFTVVTNYAIDQVSFE